MEPAAAHALLGTARFIDVRRSHEYNAGHVEGAVWITLRELPGRLDELEQDKTVVVTCQIGQRSGIATELLREHGYDAHNLEGGLEAWVADGFQLASSHGGPGRVIDGVAETLED